MIDPNKNVGSPCKQTRRWAFIGYLKDGTSVPLGVFTSFDAGTEAGTAWYASDPKASLWQGHLLYEEMYDDE